MYDFGESNPPPGGITLQHELTAGSNSRPCTGKVQTRHKNCNLYVTMWWLDHIRSAIVKFPKSWLWTLGCRQKIHRFFFSHTWGTCFKYLLKLCPYVLIYLALHIMQWFSHILHVIDVFTPKIRRKFFDFYILWNKTNVAYTRLAVIARTKYYTLQLQRQTDLLLCTVNCFPQWVHPQNMAVGDLAFYYTLYLWTEKDIIKHFAYFEITKCKIFLVRGKGAAPCNTQKIKGPEIWNQM